MQEAWLRFLVRKLDPACCSQEFARHSWRSHTPKGRLKILSATAKTLRRKINFFFFKGELFALENERDVSGTWSVSKLGDLLAFLVQQVRPAGIWVCLTSRHPSHTLWPATPFTGLKTSLISGVFTLPS